MKKEGTKTKNFTVINPKAAGIDIGSMKHYVCVLTEEDEPVVRSFGTYTPDLNSLADYLISYGVNTVAMESTGNYWIPLFSILEGRGIDVCLVNARHVKNVSGRKTDVSDCQWIQKLHTFGLLGASFIPDEETRKLRTYVRQREDIEKEKSRDLQHIGKALGLMNIKLQHIVSDLEGVSAMSIILDIASGVTDATELSKHRNKRMKASEEEIKLSLSGNYSYEHLFMLKQSLSSYDFHKKQMVECEKEIELILSRHLRIKEGNAQANVKSGNVEEKQSKRRKSRKNEYNFDVNAYLKEIVKVDLTEVTGFQEKTILTIISEIGTDLSKWKTSKHFVSWLRLCPNPLISGDKVLKNRSMRTSNRVSKAFRIAAQSLHNSQTPLGSFYRRLSHLKGSPTAIKAVARKLAVIFYKMMVEGVEFVKHSLEYYESKYKEQIINSLYRKAKHYGYILQKKELVA